MAMVSNIQGKSTAATGLGRVYAALADRYARYMTYRKCINELSALSNRELRDLGLSRSTIRSVAYEEAYLKG